MAGGIDKLPSGSWRVRWRDAAGRRRASVFESVEVAREALRERLVEVDRARAGLAPAPVEELTLTAMSGPWLARRRPGAMAPGSRRSRMERRARDNQAHLERHVLPALGDLRPSQLTPEVLGDFIHALEQKASGRRGGTLGASTVRNVIITLRKMLADHGHRIRVSVRVTQGPPVWLREPAHVGRFLDACRPDWFRVAAALAVYSGLRRGEVAALRWSDVDFRRRVIVVSRSWDTGTKGGETRVVPLAPELAAVLRGWRTPGDEVVVDAGAGWPRVARLSRAAAARAGVTSVTFHQLRHTFASHVAERLPIRALQGLLGHKAVATTERYAHVAPDVAARDSRALLSFRGSGSRVGHGRGRKT